MTNGNLPPQVSQGNDKEHGHSVAITVVNEDNGREHTLHGGKGTPLAALFEQMYDKVGVSRQPDDRLRSECNGEDVFGFGQMKLGEYIDAGHCPELVWLFAGGTGGAAEC